MVPEDGASKDGVGHAPLDQRQRRFVGGELRAGGEDVFLARSRHGQRQLLPDHFAPRLGAVEGGFRVFQSSAGIRHRAVPVRTGAAGRSGHWRSRFSFGDIGAGQSDFLRPAARHQLGDLGALGFDLGTRDIERIAVVAVFDRRQLLTGFDPVALMHQHRLDAAFDVEGQIDLTDIDIAGQDEGAGIGGRVS